MNVLEYIFLSLYNVNNILRFKTLLNSLARFYIYLLLLLLFILYYYIIYMFYIV